MTIFTVLAHRPTNKRVLLAQEGAIAALFGLPAAVYRPEDDEFTLMGEKNGLMSAAFSFPRAEVNQFLSLARGGGGKICGF